MREVEAISRDSLDQVRQAVRGYQARGLAEEIEGVRQVLATAGIAFDMDLAPTDLAPRQAGADGLMHIYHDPGNAELVAAAKAHATFVVPPSSFRPSRSPRACWV